MAKRSKKTTEGGKNGSEGPRSLTIAQAGIRTSSDFANLMSALMSDLIEGKVAPGVGNATSNAGGKLLKMVEMAHKYGNTADGRQTRILQIAFEEEKVTALPELAV